MGLLLLIPGVILLSTDGWFKDQHIVGESLAWAGGGLIVLQNLLIVLGFVGVFATIKKKGRW